MSYRHTVALFLGSLLVLSSASASNEQAAPSAHGKTTPDTLFPPPQMNKSKTTLPQKTELIEPLFMALIPGTSVTLKWNAVTRAENYHLQVATDATFKWLKVDEAFVKNPSYNLSQLESGKTYYWRVAAIKNSNDSMYIRGPFETSSFEVK